MEFYDGSYNTQEDDGVFVHGLDWPDESKLCVRATDDR